MKRIVKNAVMSKGKGTVVILCGVVISVLFAVGGCDKLRRIDVNGIKPLCEYVNEENIDKTLPIINEFLKSLPDSLGDEQKLQELVTWFKSHPCIIDASILCVSCIYTLPPQSEILISFKENGVTKELILDISMGEPLKAIRYHEGYGNNCDKDVIISAYEYENAPSDPVGSIDMKIVNNCLKIKFSASGCDGSTWVVELIGLGNYDKSNPPQTTLRLSLNNKEMCAAVITKEVSFNLEPLKEYFRHHETDQLYLNISDKGILYEY